VIPRQRTSRRPEHPSARHALHALLFGLGTALVLSIVLFANLGPRVYEVREGEVSQLNVKSPKKLSYVSQVRTRAERERAAGAVPDQLVTDPALMSRQRQGLNTLLQNISADRTSLSPTQRRESIKRLTNPPLSDTTAGLLATLDDTRLSIVFQESQRLLLETMRERVTEARAQELIRQLPSMASEQLSEAERSVVVEVVSRFVRSNLVVDQERTTQLRDDARQAVAPVQVTVENGEIILREGQVVTAADLEKLEMLGLRNPQTDWRLAAAGILLAFVFISVLGLYVYTFQPALVSRDKPLLLLSLVMVVVVLAAKIVVPGRPLWIYVFPLPAVAMLLATLLDARLAIFTSGLLAVLVAYIGGGSLEYAAMLIAACTVAAAAVYRRERGQAFFIGGLLAALAQFATAAAFMLAGRGDDWQLAVTIGFESLVNGLGSGILAAGGTILLGRMFGITTTWQLLELANPTHPLLRRLMSEAPGTYHHSLIVGNLAERSAEEIGADPLLTRVASYYHDIGKLRRPYFFVENQAEGLNPHDSLDPSESARIIAAHVTDGVEIAERYGLPPRIREMIPQHHGTRLVSFFYQRATQEGNSEARVEDFSYAGPKPQSKEAAIVMLSDSVEAAARASRDHSPEAISGLVDKIILQRVSEGQLDECDLTLSDLQKIRRSFATLLVGMYHPRIEYPDRAGEAVREAAAQPALQGSSSVRTPPAEEAPLASQP
jgi:putative nucleotidyltransferase with HDIG domain